MASKNRLMMTQGIRIKWQERVKTKGQLEASQKCLTIKGNGWGGTGVMREEEYFFVGQAFEYFKRQVVIS